MKTASVQDPLPKHIKAAFKLFNRCITRYNGIFIDKKIPAPRQGRRTDSAA